MPKPPKERVTTVSIYLTRTTLAALDAAAVREIRSRSALCRAIVHAYLRDQGPAAPRRDARSTAKTPPCSPR